MVYGVCGNTKYSIQPHNISRTTVIVTEEVEQEEWDRETRKLLQLTGRVWQTILTKQSFHSGAQRLRKSFQRKQFSRVLLDL